MRKARKHVRNCFLSLAGYLAVLTIWGLDVLAPVRADEAAFSTFVILAFFVPVIILFLLFDAAWEVWRFNRYQCEHLKLLQHHNRAIRRIDSA